MKPIIIERLLDLLEDANRRGRGELDSGDLGEADWRELEREFWKIIELE